MEATINQINRELRELATAHVQIKSYFYGDFLATYESNDVDQTSLLANINDAVIGEHFITLNIKIIVADKVDDGKENAVDIESDTLQIINDIYQVMYYSDRWQRLGITNAGLTPQKFTEKGGSVLNGWFANILFKVKKKEQGTCDLPFINYSYE